MSWKIGLGWGREVSMKIQKQSRAFGFKGLDTHFQIESTHYGLSSPSFFQTKLNGLGVETDKDTYMCRGCGSK